MMSRFIEAIKEYEHEDENGQARLIYAYFGLAIYHSQELEETFSIMLIAKKIIKKNLKTNDEVIALSDSIDQTKKTMGIFINEIKQCYSLTDKIVEDLSELLDKRNYLVHQYFKKNIFKVYSDTGRKEMLQFFTTFVDESIRVDLELKQYYQDYIKKLGITEDQIQELYDELIQAEMKLDKNSSEK